MAVLPVLVVRPVVPANSMPNANDERAYSALFVRDQVRAGKLRIVTFASRLAVLLEMLGVAALLFALGRRLFGEMAGTLAASLWLLSPFVLGLGHLDAVDPAFTLTVVGWSWALLRWTYRPTMLRAVIVGFLGAAVVLSDVTGLLVAALGLVVMLLYGRSRLPRWGLRQCVVAGAVSWAAVWVFYIALDPRVALDPTLVLPSPYFQGIRYLASNDTQPAPGYLLGAAWTGGQWWYWPGALVVKTVPTTLLLLLVGPIGWRTVDRSTRWRAVAVLAAPALLLLAFNLTTPRDIGLRYLLPVIALWLVAASSLVRYGPRLGPGARCGGDRRRRNLHHRLRPGLPRVGGTAIRPGLSLADQFGRGLGPGPLPSAELECGEASLGRLLRSAGSRVRPGSRIAPAPRHAAGQRERLGGGIGHRPDQRRAAPARLAPGVLPRRRARRVDPSLPFSRPPDRCAWPDPSCGDMPVRRSVVLARSDFLTGRRHRTVGPDQFEAGGHGRGLAFDASWRATPPPRGRCRTSLPRP